MAAAGFRRTTAARARQIRRLFAAGGSSRRAFSVGVVCRVSSTSRHSAGLPAGSGKLPSFAVPSVLRPVAYQAARVAAASAPNREAKVAKEEIRTERPAPLFGGAFFFLSRWYACS